MAFKDILFTTDIQFLNGDFRVLESDEQHIEHIFTADKGHFRQFPLIGLGLFNLDNASVDAQRLKQDIKLQLRSDNYTVRSIGISDTFQISVDATRVK